VTKITEKLQKGDALVVVDVQNDFCPEGALPIEDGDKVVPVLNRWIDAAIKKDLPAYISRDWHPVDHISFKQRGGKWPPHCLQDTWGARFHPDLKIPESAIKITKGVRFDQDQNSVFDQTGLERRLKDDGIQRLFVGGLAEDVCVQATVLDGRAAGFDIVLIEDATRPVTPADGKEARENMREEGVVLIRSE
jgi:nicotinamidase/pyrazinamidase